MGLYNESSDPADGAISDGKCAPIDVIIAGQANNSLLYISNGFFAFLLEDPMRCATKLLEKAMIIRNRPNRIALPIKTVFTQTIGLPDDFGIVNITNPYFIPKPIFSQVRHGEQRLNTQSFDYIHYVHSGTSPSDTSASTFDPSGTIAFLSLFFLLHDPTKHDLYPLIVGEYDSNKLINENFGCLQTFLHLKFFPFSPSRGLLCCLYS